MENQNPTTPTNPIAPSDVPQTTASATSIPENVVVPPPQDPVSFQPEGGNKKKIILIVVILLLVLTAVGVSAYFYLNRNQTESILTSTPEPTATPDPTADWKSYTNQDLGFSFKYPNDWKINAMIAGEGSCNGSQVISPSQKSRINICKVDDADGIGTKNSERILIVDGHKGYGYEIQQPADFEYAYSFSLENTNERDLLWFIAGSDLTEKEKVKNLLDQILSTFKFIESTQSEVVKADLASIENWTNKSISGLSFKLPQGTTIEEGICTFESYEKCYLIKNHDKNLVSPSSISVYVKTYKGGSRREEADLDLPLADYSFKDKSFGDIKGLEAINNCKISTCTQARNIIFVVGGKLILIRDGVYKSGNDTVLESTVVNSIVSTFKVSN